MEAIKPRQLLKEVEAKYPTVWTIINDFREDKGINLDWPDWCYIPIAAGTAIATGGDISKAAKVAFDTLQPATIVAAATWRLSQGIYRFNTDVYNELVNQPLEGNIPCEILKRLPEYCVYIETQGAQYLTIPIVGFFAHLEYDLNNQNEELRFVFIAQSGHYMPASIHLGNWSIDEGIRQTIEISEKTAESLGDATITEMFDNNRKFYKGVNNAMKLDLVPYIQLLLYLCAENADMVKPPHPITWKQRNNKIEPKKAVKFVKVGQAIGEVLRVYKKGKSEENVRYVDNGVDTEHSSKRPHMRKAHWHHYWIGENRQELIIKWLPPIPVNMNEDLNIPTTINKIER